MVFEASLLLPKSLSSDVSVVFWSVTGPVDKARESCALGAAVLLVADFGGGPLSLCLGLLKANSCLPEYFQCRLCREVSWPGSVVGHIPSAAAPPLSFGGGVCREGMGSSSPPASHPKPRDFWRFHPKFVSLSNVFTFLCHV